MINTSGVPMGKWACLLLLITKFAFAQELPRERGPCHFGSHCVDYDGLDVVFKHTTNVLNRVGVTNKALEGVYYQRGVGSSCVEAFENAQNRMLFNRSEFRCDMDGDGSANELRCESGTSDGGPALYRGSCMRSRRGEIVAWIECDRPGGRRIRQERPSAIGFVLLTSLQRQEVLNRRR